MSRCFARTTRANLRGELGLAPFPKSSRLLGVIAELVRLSNNSGAFDLVPMSVLGIAAAILLTLSPMLGFGVLNKRPMFHRPAYRRPVVMIESYFHSSLLVV